MADEAQPKVAFHKISTVTAFILLVELVWELGWPLQHQEYITLKTIAFISTIIYLSSTFISYFRKEDTRPTLRVLLFQIITSFIILGLIYGEEGHQGFMNELEIWRLVLTVALIAVPGLMSLTRVFEWLLNKSRNGTPLMPPALQFVVSLGLVILVGTGLLFMPNSTYADVDLSFTDALFTSTSAVCVTGLNVVDFCGTYTLLGQIFVLALIQIGGFGIMTFAYFVAMIAGQGFSLRDRVLLKDLINENTLDSAVSFIQTVVIVTFTVELIGATFLYFSWRSCDINLMGQPLWWHCLFHSISAFCNAGFSTFPNNLMEPGVVNSYWGQGIIMLLIISGGLGFGIYLECKNQVIKRFFHNHHHYKIRWTPYFKIVIYTTIILIIGGAIMLAAFGQKSPDMSWERHLWICLFNSVTTRTAGFNVNDLALYLPAPTLILCALMIIGGSPGGTAGGMRTTTVAIAAADIWRILRGRSYVEFFRRSIDSYIVTRCVATIVISGAWIGFSTMVCCWQEPNLSPINIFFENCSAFATVGLSQGVTPLLNDTSKYIIMLNMLAGRAGLFLFLIALAGNPKPRRYHYPSVRIPLT